MKRKKRRLVRLIVLGLLLVLAIWQFMPVDRSIPESDPDKDIFANHRANPQLVQVIKDACYDCHSHETEYPWYSYVAPIGNWLQGHINHAREHLNFSTWAEYDADTRDHKLEHGAEKVMKKEMPLTSFLIAHPEARISEDQRQEIADWFESLRE